MTTAVILAMMLAPSIHISGQGVEISDQLHTLRLTALTDGTVRVQDSLPDALPPFPRPSLVNVAPKGKCTVLQATDRLTLQTARLKVVYEWLPNRLSFYDASGKLLAAEPLNGRTLTPTMVGNERGLATTQRFAMSPGEAYYGLGGHQLGDLNYRGDVITLVQKNTEAANPFLLSSRGYGVLNNAACGQVVALGTAPEPITAKALFDDEGEPGALSGHYFAGENFETHIVDRRDPAIAFDWKAEPIEGLTHTNFSVRWSGTIQTEQAGDYEFLTRADDGARLWVDGKQIINDWAIKPASTARGRIALQAHRRYSIKLEYFQGGGDAEISLQWRLPAQTENLAWSSEFTDGIDYEFIAGPKFDDIIAQYRQFTGPAPLFGKWAYGFWQCKERYKTQQELLDVAAEFRRRNIPIDNIVQDWFYWDPHPWGSHEFDLNRYPNMTDGIAALHAENFHFMISVWGKFTKGSANYAEMERHGYLLPPTKSGFDGPETRYYDPSNPEARATYWKQLRTELFNKGVDAWWLDASEPELNMEEYRTAPTYLGVASKILNAYPLMHTGGVYNGQRSATGSKRVFLLTRSVFAGQQRNSAATWSGDINGDWATFAKQIPAGLNFCMAGVPYWCTDIGGFFSRPNTDPDYEELFVRWFQYGAFCPIFRVHGTGTDKEPWRWSPPAQSTLVKFDRLRYRLMPYIYSLAWRVTNEGYTMMRALPMDFPNDPQVRNIKDEFLFGPSLLIAPVMQAKATTRLVYLPAGTWYDFWSNKRYTGGRAITVPAPLDSMPIFVRAGSIIPYGPNRQFAADLPDSPFEWRVYPGADGEFTLYDDAGDGYAYERGEFSTSKVRWDDKRQRLTVGARVGSFPGMRPLRYSTKVIR